ncbi:MAG: helix-turn-helix domain-containing protein [Pseudomonadota bacterium]
MEDGTSDWFSSDISTFGDRIAGAREQSGMSQEVLAKRLGVKLSTLLAWEEDLNEPRANKLSMLAGILNVSLGWLLNGEGEGIDAPDDLTIPHEVSDLLTEVRQLKAQMLRTADRLGVVEKRLRQAVKTS